MSNKTQTWRRWILALWAFTVVIWATSSVHIYLTDAYLGFYSVKSGVPFTARMIVNPGGPAFRAGLRSGDTVDLRTLTPMQRYEVLRGNVAGSRISFPVRRNGRLMTFTYIVPSWPYFWKTDVMLPIAGLWILIFAGLVAWRRADNAESRVLAVFLILVAFDVCVSGWICTSLPLNVLATVAVSLLVFNTALFAVYASLIAQPLSLMRRVLAWATYVTAAAGAVLLIASFIAKLTAVVDPFSPVFRFAEVSSNIAACVLPLLCGVAAIRAARGIERARLIWATCSVGSFLITGFAIYAMNLSASSYASQLALEIASQATYLLLPIGLTYSLLNRRLLDIGFVLNRAAIFSGVSIVIVGLFVLAEWALSEWMRTASHETNIAVSAALALSLGLSIRFVHAKVEHVVDRVMFRKRREDEEAIRKMAREAPYITDAGTLLVRVQQTLLQHADASFVNSLLDDGRGRFGDVNENDPALVTLRAEHARLDLHATQTSIQGEWAYPMVARGRLVGALVLGPKQSQESYAPDESAAIAQLAHSVAGALDVLGIGAHGDNAVTALLAHVDSRFSALSAQLTDLTEELRGQTEASA